MGLFSDAARSNCEISVFAASFKGPNRIRPVSAPGRQFKCGNIPMDTVLDTALVVSNFAYILISCFLRYEV